MFFKLGNPEPQFVLHILAGDREGAEIELPRDREVIIGRAQGLDLTVEDTRVSRQHVRLNVAGRQIILIDLNSRNGTFVNDERVMRARLKEGDRIRVGSCLIEVENAARAHAEKKSGSANGNGHNAETSTATESGQLDQTSLRELLRQWHAGGRSGLIVLRSGAVTGRVFVKDGRVRFASVDGRPSFTPRKALLRLAVWQTGSYHIEPPPESQPDLEFGESPTVLLDEISDGVAQLATVRTELPAIDASVLVPTPPPANLKDLTAGEHEVYTLVLKHGTLESVLDHFPGTDLDACRHFATLLRQGYIVVV